MGQASALAKLFDPAEVDGTLGHAAAHGRFAEANLASILDHHISRPSGRRHLPSEARSLTQGTRAWSRRSPVNGATIVGGEVTP